MWSTPLLRVLLIRLIDSDEQTAPDVEAGVERVEKEMSWKRIA